MLLYFAILFSQLSPPLFHSPESLLFSYSFVFLAIGLANLLVFCSCPTLPLIHLIPLVLPLTPIPARLTLFSAPSFPPTASFPAIPSVLFKRSQIQSLPHSHFSHSHSSSFSSSSILPLPLPSRHFIFALKLDVQNNCFGAFSFFLISQTHSSLWYLRLEQNKDFAAPPPPLFFIFAHLFSSVDIFFLSFSPFHIWAPGHPRLPR